MTVLVYFFLDDIKCNVQGFNIVIFRNLFKEYHFTEITKTKHYQLNKLINHKLQ